MTDANLGFTRSACACCSAYPHPAFQATPFPPEMNSLILRGHQERLCLLHHSHSLHHILDEKLHRAAPVQEYRNERKKQKGVFLCSISTSCPAPTLCCALMRCSCTNNLIVHHFVIPRSTERRDSCICNNFEFVTAKTKGNIALTTGLPIYAAPFLVLSLFLLEIQDPHEQNGVDL